MTSLQAEKQIEAIKIATKEASKSKESAVKFLTEAGIIKEGKKYTKDKR